MDRRAFILTAAGGLLAAPLAAEAQPAAKVYRIGFLGNSTPALEANLVGPFREGLRELGYVEGRNIVIEYRWAEGPYERFPVLIAELLARKVDVIVTAGTPATQAVKKATTSVPLVMVAVGDPVATGIAASLRRPGGNITGLTSTGTAGLPPSAVRRPTRGGPALDDRTERFAQQHHESFGTTSAIRRSICSASSKTGLSRISSAPASATSRRPRTQASGGP